MSWDAADVRMIIDEVGRWRARALDPQVSNWAQCMTAPVLSGLMAQLTEIEPERYHSRWPKYSRRRLLLILRKPPAGIFGRS